ncbi:MAG: hypothetical protein ABR976_15040 [Terracidiphilus sp.]
MGTQESGFERIPYRLRFGAVGHRKLEDPAALEALVKAAIDTEIEKLFSEESRLKIKRVREAGTTSISFRVLSPLAEGADRLVARAVLGYPDARLDAVLPMVIEDYLEDFASEESRKEFEELLSRCRKPALLRTRLIQDDRHDPNDQAELRRDAYAHAGRYVVDHCDVLIAVWDGEPSRGRGGTAEIVQYAREQKRPIIRVWADSFQLLNRGNGLDASALDVIDQFNRHAITLDERASYVKSLDHDHFEKPENATEIPATTRQLVNTRLFPYYAQASIMAKQYRDRFHRAGKYVYVLSAAAVGCAALAVLFPPIAWLGFSAELLLLIVMALTFRQALREHFQQHWIESRFLAERIRCGIFMAICGVEPRPIEVLPYMGHSQTVNDWTVRVFDEIWDRLPRLSSCTDGECLILNPYVREVWIGDQVKFHKDKREREARARKRLAKAGAIVLPATILAATLHLLLLLWRPPGMAPEFAHLLHRALHQGLSFIALLFPAIAASLAGMEAHREHLRLEKRSANMGPQLERVNRQMASATDPERFESLLQQVDEIMLRETQDWLMLMRYAEIKAG